MKQCRIELSSCVASFIMICVLLIIFARSAQHVTTESDQRDAQRQLDQEKERLQTARLQLAKKNRQVVSIQRQIDNIPDRTELAQYQRRFLELYNQGECTGQDHSRQSIYNRIRFVRSECQASRDQAVLHAVQHAGGYQNLHVQGAVAAQLDSRQLHRVSRRWSLQIVGHFTNPPFGVAVA